MSSAVLVKSYAAPAFCKKEILRYAGCKDATLETLALCDECIKEAEGSLVYKVCWCELTVTTDGGVCDFGNFRVISHSLAQNLKDSQRVIVFAATVGVEIDRLIAKYGRLSPSKALMLQSIGAERIEALCDAFCEDYSKTFNKVLKPRFSPGYGDLPLETQKDIFALLNCSKLIGATLNDSLLMSPSKSVTAFAGLCD